MYCTPIVLLKLQAWCLVSTGLHDTYIAVIRQWTLGQQSSCSQPTCKWQQPWSLWLTCSSARHCLAQQKRWPLHQQAACQVGTVVPTSHAVHLLWYSSSIMRLVTACDVRCLACMPTAHSWSITVQCKTWMQLPMLMPVLHFMYNNKSQPILAHKL